MVKPYRKDAMTAGGSKRVTVREQLKMLIKKSHYAVICDVLDHLSIEAGEDLCYGLIAAVKWGIHRPYPSAFMQTIYESCIWLINDGDEDV